MRLNTTPGTKIIDIKLSWTLLIINSIDADLYTGRLSSSYRLLLSALTVFSITRLINLFFPLVFTVSVFYCVCVCLLGKTLQCKHTRTVRPYNICASFIHSSCSVEVGLQLIPAVAERDRTEQIASLSEQSMSDTYIYSLGAI